MPTNKQPALFLLFKTLTHRAITYLSLAGGDSKVLIKNSFPLPNSHVLLFFATKNVVPIFPDITDKVDRTSPSLFFLQEHVAGIVAARLKPQSLQQKRKMLANEERQNGKLEGF